MSDRLGRSAYRQREIERINATVADILADSEKLAAEMKSPPEWAEWDSAPIPLLSPATRKRV